MRTDDVTSDRELHDLLRRAMDAVADTVDEPRPLGADLPARRRWLLPSAAATIVAVGVAALLVVASGDGDTAVRRSPKHPRSLPNSAGSSTSPSPDRAEFNAGQLQGPWRQTPSPAAPANTEACTWLPGGTALDVSSGEPQELVDYLAVLAESIALGDATPPADLSPTVPPPRLIDGGTCERGVTTERVELALAALG